MEGAEELCGPSVVKLIHVVERPLCMIKGSEHFIDLIFYLIPLGLMKIQDWTRQSLKRRLQKSLSHDWINEKTSHKFPLREYYVQLEWRKRIRTAMGSETVTLTSIHDLIRQLQLTDCDQTRHAAFSVVIEGKITIVLVNAVGLSWFDMWY